MDDGSKAAYIAGYLRGLEINGLLMSGAVCSALKRPVDECNAVGWQAYSATSRQYIGVKLRQFLSGMNDFYGDYRNQRIDFTGAMNYVGRSASGDAAADLEKLAEHMRRNAK